MRPPPDAFIDAHPRGRWCRASRLRCPLSRERKGVRPLPSVRRQRRRRWLKWRSGTSSVAFCSSVVTSGATGDDARQQQLLGWLLSSSQALPLRSCWGSCCGSCCKRGGPPSYPNLAPAVGGERVGGTGGADEREVDGKGEVEIAFDGKNSVAPLEVVGEVEEEGEPERWKEIRVAGASSTKSMEVEFLLHQH